MPIRISQGLVVGLPAEAAASLEDGLWDRSGGVCEICVEPMDRAEELEAGRRPGGGAVLDGLQLSHARCHHDVIDARDRERLAEEIGDDPAAYLARRGWARSRRRRVEGRVPLLRAGSERRWRSRIEGTLPDGSGVWCGRVVFKFEKYGGEDGWGGVDEEGWPIEKDRDDKEWTVVLIDADYPASGFVTLTEAEFSFPSPLDRQEVSLESAELGRVVRLSLALDGDEQGLRARFTPAVQLALASRGIGFDDRLEADHGAVIAARWIENPSDDLPVLIDLLGDALWLRAALTGDPPGRVPDREELRALALGEMQAGPPTGA